MTILEELRDIFIKSDNEQYSKEEIIDLLDKISIAKEEEKERG